MRTHDLRTLAVLLVAWPVAAGALGPVAPEQVVPVAVPAAPARPALPNGLDPFADRPRVDQAVGPAEAVALAERWSPVIAAMAQDVQMARQMLAMARARTQPMAAVTVRGTYGDGSMIVPGAPGVAPEGSRMVPAGASLDAGFAAMYPLYTGGRLGAQVQAEGQRVQASAADLEAMRLDLALEVLTMVYRLGTMLDMIQVAQEAVDTNQERLRIDRAALAAGRLPEVNVLRDQAELAAAQQAHTNAVRDYRVMLADLRTLLGVHPLSRLEVTVPAAAEGLANTPEQDLQLAVRQRPELAAARARWAAAGHDVRAAKGAYLPQVALMGMGDVYANRMNDMNRWGEYLVGLSVSLPVLDGGERKAAVRQARAAQERLRALDQQAALQVARDVVQAHERLDAARQNVATAQTALTAAREDYRLAQLRYQAGRSVNVEVLDALRMRTMAETNLRLAELELRLAQAQLRRAVGDPTLKG